MRAVTIHSTGRRRLGLLSALFLALVLAGMPPALWADGVVRFYYFSDPNCTSCQEVRRDVIEPLVAEFGSRVAIDERNIGEAANFELMIDLEQSLGVTAGNIPQVVIGDRVLAGADAIRAELRDLVLAHLDRGGVALPAVTVAEEPHVVRAVLFSSETCPHCRIVIDEALPPILERYGEQLEIVVAQVSQRHVYQAWVAAMEARDIPPERQAVPMLLVGDAVLTGSVQIPQELPGLVDRYLMEGGRDLPEDMKAMLAAAEAALTATPQPATPPIVGAPEPPAIHAVYFYQVGCYVCDRVEHDLRYIMDKYPQVVINRYDVREHAALNQYLSARYGIPEEKHLIAPSLFLGDGYLLGDAIRAPAIEALVVPFLKDGAPDPSAGWDAERQVAEGTIVDRFRSFGLLTVAGAGLLDGVNPCAIATMIFLVSYLSLHKRRGSALLLTGAAFTLGVFLTYLSVGLGFMRLLGSLPFLHTIGRWLYGLTAILCLALAVGSILDYRKAREGRLEEMSLKLPERLRGWSKALIRKGISSRRFVLSAFLLGLGVSLIELACTGQVYLPTIIFVMNLPEWRAQASLLLVLYNLMFILPLVVVFLLAYFGTTSQQLIDWMTKHTASVKLGTAALFLLLAGWLLHSVVAL